MGKYPANLHLDKVMLFRPPESHPWLVLYFLFRARTGTSPWGGYDMRAELILDPAISEKDLAQKLRHLADELDAGDGPQLRGLNELFGPHDPLAFIPQPAAAPS